MSVPTSSQALFQLLLSFRGRTQRGTFVLTAALLVLVFIPLHSFAADTLGSAKAVWLFPPFYWAALALCTKRFHDADASGERLLLAAVPIIGPPWALLELLFRGGTPGENRFGPEPRTWGLDYLRVKPPPGAPLNTVNDVTGIHEVEVAAVATPETVEGVREAVLRSSGAVSIGGGRFSMGGQTASPGSLHIDMRGLNRVVALKPIARSVRVQAGVRWCDLQKVLDAHDMAVRIMQTYANFTVGGALSVNCHGRYVGEGPLARSVLAVLVVMADGELVEATPTDNSELFYGVIGGYGGLGVVVEIELSLAENTRVERSNTTMATSDYVPHFRQSVRTSTDAIFHNADLYPPHYTRVRSVTWRKTDKLVTRSSRLHTLSRSHRLFQYLFWATSELPAGKWRREHLLEPLVYLSSPVHWRNFEAGYDVAELEPSSRARKTYVLQEYFVPIDQFEDFSAKMAEIFQRYSANVINVSVRHALQDPGTLLAWAREECFAYVVYYKQGTSEASQNEVATWTRELIDAVLSSGGTYYLPYQPHATAEQFHRAYPRAREYFALKAKVDPDCRFRNSLWDKYYVPTLSPGEAVTPGERGQSEFRAVFDNDVWRDRFYLFLQNVYGILPEDRFHNLIRAACAEHDTDEATYRYIQEHLHEIRPALAVLRLALPALAKQKREMARQTLLLLGERTTINGYLEIGSKGRYISALSKHLTLGGAMVLQDEAPPTRSPEDIVERGRLGFLGIHLPLEDYTPVPSDVVPEESLDLVTCYIGLHHVVRERLDAYVTSIVRALRPGGRFILRDHDVDSEPMRCFVSLVHTVFNAGLELPWTQDLKEHRAFEPLQFWTAYLKERGLTPCGKPLYQDHDPSNNALMIFEKVGSEGKS